MDYYIDIDVLPDPEFKETVLMSALFSKFHRALVTNTNKTVGVSFPKVGKTLGNCLRLHGSHIDLEELMSGNWLKGLNDYTRKTDIKEIPNSVKYRVVKRRQVKSNVERLYRRSVAKGWLTEEEAEKKIETTPSQRTDLPFVRLKSASTKQNFPLFVEHSEVLEQPVIGRFNKYGLSDTATIPWF